MRNQKPFVFSKSEFAYVVVPLAILDVLAMTYMFVAQIAFYCQFNVADRSLLRLTSQLVLPTIMFVVGIVVLVGFKRRMRVRSDFHSTTHTHGTPSSTRS